jgi:CRP-like cAMP-binding protein
LPRETLALVEPDLKRASLAQGAVCFEAGQRIDHVYFPLTGMISLLVATGNGEMVETGTVGREGAAGLQSGFGESYSYGVATVQIAGDFATIAAARFKVLVGNSLPIRDLIFRYTEILWSEAQQTAACNTVHAGSARLCRWLLQTADRIDSNHVPLTQEYLADMLGVRRTTVTLLAQELQSRGAIRYSRGRIHITDRRALEALACECYHAIKQNNLALKV